MLVEGLGDVVCVLLGGCDGWCCRGAGASSGREKNL